MRGGSRTRARSFSSFVAVRGPSSNGSVSVACKPRREI
jgi:hypothetical protein